MSLQDKIYRNIVKQITISQQLQTARQEVDRLDRENSSIIGGMNVLAEFYKEETGNDLQQEINTDPQWKAILEKAEQEARVAASREVTVAQDEQPQQPAPSRTPGLRKVGSNKIVMPVDPATAKAQPESMPTSVQDRTRPPVAIVIEGDAPPPPSSAEIRELNDED